MKSAQLCGTQGAGLFLNLVGGNGEVLTGSWNGVKVIAQQLKGSDLNGLLLLSL